MELWHACYNPLMEHELPTKEVETKTMKTEPKPSEFPTLEKAKDLILTPFDPAYQKVHSTKLEGKPRKVRTVFGPQEVLMIGPKHSYEPNLDENPMLAKTIEHIKDYLERVPKEKQLIMVEGFHDKKPYAQPTLDESIRKGGEAQATVFIAQEAGVEVVSPEVDNKTVTEKCLAAGFSKEDIALFYALRAVPGTIRSEKPLSQAALEGCLEAGLIDEQSAIEDHDRAAAEAASLINQRAEASLGRAFIAEDPSASITSEESKSLLRPDPEGLVPARIGIECNRARDEYILDTIDAAIKEGKSPLIVYGSSHLVCLRPALVYLYAD